MITLINSIKAYVANTITKAITPLASKEYVIDAVKDTVDESALNKYATKTDVSAKADKTDLDAKADKTDLDAKADKTDLDAKADKTDLDAKADKTDLANYATKNDVSVNKELYRTVYNANISGNNVIHEFTPKIDGAFRRLSSADIFITVGSLTSTRTITVYASVADTPKSQSTHELGVASVTPTRNVVVAKCDLCHRHLYGGVSAVSSVSGFTSFQTRIFDHIDGGATYNSNFTSYIAAFEVVVSGGSAEQSDVDVHIVVHGTIM